MAQDWLRMKVNILIGPELLQQAKQEAAAFLQSASPAAINAEVDRMIERLVQKLTKVVSPTDRLTSDDLQIEAHLPSKVTIIHNGQPSEYVVDGLICFTGRVTVHYSQGGYSSVALFAKWVSHPFWQYGKH